MDISKLDTAEVLAALWNHSRQLGMSVLDTRGARGEVMSVEQARAILEENPFRYFDYLWGRVLKVDLSNPKSVDLWLYNRDNGNGAGERAIASLTKVV